MKGRKPGIRLIAVLAAVVALCSMSFVLAGCSCSSQQTSTKVAVPDVVFMEGADAQQTLVNAGLTIGDEKFALSDSVATGDVISQEPAAATEVEKGTSVALVISCGKLNAKTVSVPDLTGKTQDEAEKSLQAVNLVPVPGNPVYSETVEPGKVCQQSAKAGSQAKEGDQITFNVSLGKKMVDVPDETGKKFDDAKADLDKVNLGVDKATAYDDKVPADVVISQSIPAKTTVAEGTKVTLTVSLGAKPAEKVKVPNIMTYSLEDAENALKSAGLNYTYSGDPDGTVDAQDPVAGTEVDPGSTVKFTLQQAQQLVSVPDVSGMSGTDALAAMQQADLDLDYDTDNPDRVIESTNPSAGALVDRGSTVQAVYPPDPEPEPAGAWTFNGEAASSVDGDAQAAFDQAAGNSGLEPIAVLAVRDVSARSYAFLCKSDADWHVVVVAMDDASSDDAAADDTDADDDEAAAADGDDGADPADDSDDAAGDASAYSMVSDVTIDITNVKTVDNPPDIGPWEVPDAPSTTLEPDDAKAAFDAAMQGYDGVGITALATLATQVVNGTNYLVVGIGAPVTADPVNQVYAVTVYAPAGGDPEFSSVDILDLTQYM